MHLCEGYIIQKFKVRKICYYFLFNRFGALQLRRDVLFKGAQMCLNLRIWGVYPFQSGFSWNHRTISFELYMTLKFEVCLPVCECQKLTIISSLPFVRSSHRYFRLNKLVRYPDSLTQKLSLNSISQENSSNKFIFSKEEFHFYLCFLFDQLG